MKVFIAVLLLALPLWCAWAFYVAARSGRLTWWRALVYVLGFLVLLLGNPLANAYLLSPVDSFLQGALFEKARSAGLLGADEARVRAVLGKPWKTRQLESPFSVLLYAPCKVCMASYGAPFVVYLREGAVEGFRSGRGETLRVKRP
ncbi:MAG: hypothetical protein AUG04_11735 [Deltaproteobacteria bacterium 13_1_20CM_2_69_21]|nr:MAG: hypothetical protein AUH83_11635 [Deltaproteobacteria bacterium 13_1_40CM_4_68_19]OLE62081.1 MAG: hypothetical protein AUG04_11735 [Deltaproteobacteria bacterium 13_1_20CM_2_69_21]